MNSQIFMKGDAATPRHSHSACVWNNHVVLTGGLDASLQALSIVQTMETDVRSILYSYLDWLNTPITWYKTGQTDSHTEQFTDRTEWTPEVLTGKQK